MTKLGEFKAIEQVLDEIDAMLIRMPEVPELANQRLAAKNFRIEFEKAQKNHSEDLLEQVIVLSANLTLATLNSYLPELRINDERINNNNVKINQMHQTKDKLMPRDFVELKVNLLKGLLNDAIQLDVNECRKKIDSIEREFSELEFCSQDFDQMLSEAQYELMKKYLEVGKTKEAEEYAKQFSNDMKFYAYERLKKQIPQLKEESRNEDIMNITNYMINNNLSEKKLEFWKMVMQIENPEVRLDTNLEENQKTRNKKSKIKWKEHVIDCDANMRESGISYENEEKLKDCRAFIEDYKTKQKYIKKGYNIKLKFENGIKKLKRCEIPVTMTDIALTKLIKEVNFPYSLEEISRNFFNRFEIDEIDLSKTQLKVLSERIIWIC